jgi:hypothetical protein
MEKRKLVRPQSTETVENVVVYACEAPNLCPNNSVFVYDFRPCLSMTLDLVCL